LFALAIILGGIAGVLARAYVLALVGACIGIFVGLAFYMSGLSLIILILSIIGIALISMGRDEFGPKRRIKQAAYRHK